MRLLHTWSPSWWGQEGCELVDEWILSCRLRLRTCIIPPSDPWEDAVTLSSCTLPLLPRFHFPNCLGAWQLLRLCPGPKGCDELHLREQHSVPARRSGQHRIRTCRPRVQTEAVVQAVLQWGTAFVFLSLAAAAGLLHATRCLQRLHHGRSEPGNSCHSTPAACDAHVLEPSVGKPHCKV